MSHVLADVREFVTKGKPGGRAAPRLADAESEAELGLQPESARSADTQCSRSGDDRKPSVGTRSLTRDPDLN